MLDFINVSIGFAGQQVLSDVSFHISAGERVGVTGANGAGKSTIFALLTGECMPDKGTISVPRDLTIGYLKQHVHPLHTDDTLLDYVEHAIPAVRAIQHEITDLESRVGDADGRERDRMLNRLGVLQTDFEHLGGYELSTRAQTALSGLGFDEARFTDRFNSFSGGWKMRAELARAMVARPNLLLLDEPTNFLDLPAVEWLRRFLQDFEGTLMLVSHDRYLLRSLTNVTFEVAGAALTRYAGNYDYYVEQRQQRHDQLYAAKANQDRERARTERFIDRFRSKNTKATQVQSRIKKLEKMEDIAVPEITTRTAKIRVADPPRSGHELIRLENAGITYDGEKWVLRGVDLQVVKGEKTALVGLNGLGKTTLLRVLAGSLKLSEGKRAVGHNVVIGYQAQDFAEAMNPSRTVWETARSYASHRSDRDVRGILGSFNFSGDAVEKRVEVLSGGEKMRLAFARLLLNPPNLMLLDEPTTHLDIGSRETLENALEGYSGTLLFVSHDVEFVRKVATTVIVMTPPTVQRWPGGYDYYREKTAGAEAQQAVAKKEAGKSGEGSQVSRKDLRRMKSQEREELNRQKRPLKEAVRRQEREIEKLEKEQVELTAKLGAGEQVDYASLNRRLNEVHYEMQIATEAWEAAVLALDELESGGAAEGH